MSSSAKKSGGATMGVSVKTERNNENMSGGSGGTSTFGTGGKGDRDINTTPSKSSKHGLSKSKNHATPNSKSGNGGAGGLLGGSSAAGDQGVNPAILGQQALESLYSATYVEDFIDCNDNMGDDLIRQTTRMFEMGSNYMTYIRELESAMAILLGEDDTDHIIPDQLSGEKKKAVFRLQNVLMTAQDTGDDSLQVMQSIQDHIENKTRQLDVDRKNLAEFCKEQDTPETPFKDPPPPPTERSIKRARRNRHEIYRPSILGPSSLKATSYPENNVGNNTRGERNSDRGGDNDHVHVVSSSRSRGSNKDDSSRRSRTRDGDRDTSAGDKDSHRESRHSGSNSHHHNQSQTSSSNQTGSSNLSTSNATSSSTVDDGSSGAGADGGTNQASGGAPVFDGSAADVETNAVSSEGHHHNAVAAGSGNSSEDGGGGSGSGIVNNISGTTHNKSNGRTSERTREGGQTTRSSTQASLDHNSSNSEKRYSSQGYGGSSKNTKSQKGYGGHTQEKKTKKRKAKQQSSSSSRKEDNSPQTYGIDPDEPTYCLCDQVSYGEMIGCDNDLCPIEWFHFSCVNLTTKPKGKWFCPNCRGDKPNVMKPKNVFLKELEKYNREKEEKA